MFRIVSRSFGEVSSMRDLVSGHVRPGVGHSCPGTCDRDYTRKDRRNIGTKRVTRRSPRAARCSTSAPLPSPAASGVPRRQNREAAVKRREARQKMPELRFPPLLPVTPRKKAPRTCAAHRAWVRRHRCSVRGCHNLPIECAHVRTATDGGLGLKPSDRWTISLCERHHLEQHEIGEAAFETRYDLSLIELAREFARRSPYLLKSED